MSVRKVPFVNNEYYHIYNRGIDKREIFNESQDLNRFLQSMIEFNTIDPIGSIFENSFRKEKSLGSLTSKRDKPLIDIVCFCINPNHFHFILTPIVDKGIEKFMHRLGTGYTKFFNGKYLRSGALFQGTFKSIHINSNEYLLHVSAYINLNSRVHKLRNEAPKFFNRSSWEEYTSENYNGFCKKDIVLDQFNNVSEYKKFAESSLNDILERKEMGKFLLE